MTSASIEVKRKIGEGRKAAAAGPLSSEELRKMHAYWRAANYLSVGQIYLLSGNVGWRGNDCVGKGQASNEKSRRNPLSVAQSLKKLPTGQADTTAPLERVNKKYPYPGFGRSRGIGWAHTVCGKTSGCCRLQGLPKLRRTDPA
jgi:hypothetical protein